MQVVPTNQCLRLLLLVFLDLREVLAFNGWFPCQGYHRLITLVIILRTLRRFHCLIQFNILQPQTGTLRSRFQLLLITYHPPSITLLVHSLILMTHILDACLIMIISWRHILYFLPLDVGESGDDHLIALVQFGSAGS